MTSGTAWMALLMGGGILVVAANWWLGLWSNFVTAVNLLLAGLVATSFYTNLANTMLVIDSSWFTVVDFVCIWLVFVVTFGLLRALTEQFSRIRLKFHPLVEMIGRSIGATAVGFLFLAFVSYTLLLAPMPRDAFDGFNAKGFYPETVWGALTSQMSRGSLAAHQNSQWFGNAPAAGGGVRPVGDAGDVQAFGNDLRARIAGQTNLRAETRRSGQ